MLIVSIVGARPQLVKLGPLSRQIRKNHREIILHTGQHYDDCLSQVFFRQLDLPEKDYNLNVGPSCHGTQTADMLQGIEEILLREQPGLVIVFGDTNSTLAGALAAAKLNIPLTHVEAGLRSFNREMPEEMNRVCTDHLSDLLFAPTKRAMENLEREGLGERSYLTGDIMVDALFEHLDIARNKQYLLDDFDIVENEYYLLTLHRPYTVDYPEILCHIFSALESLDYPVVFPAHPRTQKVIEQNHLHLDGQVKLTDPLGYIDFLSLEYYSKKIITDSGGVQKEAYILQKPCVTIRPETEWIETVDEGWNILVNPEDSNIAKTILSFNPPVNSDRIFGSNVATEMMEIINHTFE